MEWRRLSPTGIILLLLAFALVASAGQSRAEGDPRRGEALYVGNLPFTNGGAPCLGCHGIAGAGLGKAAGASYGPDLTAMYEGFGEDGVAAILESLEFPSMEPIYAGRPLTEAERADLAAFLQEVSGREPPRVGERLAVEAAAGTGLLLVLAGIFGRRRLRGVRGPMVAEAINRQGDKQ
jgi:mono/diheme cytochrome c family protein